MGGRSSSLLTWSTYTLTRSLFQVEGFTEALSHELKPEWNIKLTCVEPGGFRTDWAGRSMEFGERHPVITHLSLAEWRGTAGADNL